MRTYTVKGIPDDQYKALRIKAAEKELSINKAILEAIKNYLGCRKDPDTCDSIPPGSCGPDCHGFKTL